MLLLYSGSYVDVFEYMLPDEVKWIIDAWDVVEVYNLEVLKFYLLSN